MSIQDKIFDVASQLEGHTEAKAFDDIISYLGQLESELAVYDRVYNNTRELMRALNDLENQREVIRKQDMENG